MRELEITAIIDGRAVPRGELNLWESRRAAAVAKKLDLAVPDDDLVSARDALVTRKLELGHAALERRFARDIALSARASHLLTALSRGRRRRCVVELSGPEGSAETMPAFYKSAMSNGDEAVLLAACPDHYVLTKLSEDEERVIETTGGSPLVSDILLRDEDGEGLDTPADPHFPVQWTALGGAGQDHRVAGGIRHQFRDGPDGFRARLTGEFPVAMPRRLIDAHKWHLACEFSNWIEMANG